MSQIAGRGIICGQDEPISPPMKLYPVNEGAVPFQKWIDSGSLNTFKEPEDKTKWQNEREKLGWALSQLGVTKAALNKTSESNKVIVVFLTQHASLANQSLSIIGSAPQLGSRERDNALPAVELPAGDGWWFAVCRLPMGTVYDWRWVMLNKRSGKVTRGECPRRNILVADNHHLHLAKWNLPSIQWTLESLPLYSDADGPILPCVHNDIRVKSSSEFSDGGIDLNIESDDSDVFLDSDDEASTAIAAVTMNTDGRHPQTLNCVSDQNHIDENLPFINGEPNISAKCNYEPSIDNQSQNQIQNVHDQYENENTPDTQPPSNGQSDVTSQPDSIVDPSDFNQYLIEVSEPHHVDVPLSNFDVCSSLDRDQTDPEMENYNNNVLDDSSIRCGLCREVEHPDQPVLDIYGDPVPQICVSECDARRISVTDERDKLKHDINLEQNSLKLSGDDERSLTSDDASDVSPSSETPRLFTHLRDSLEKLSSYCMDTDENDKTRQISDDSSLCETTVSFKIGNGESSMTSNKKCDDSLSRDETQTPPAMDVNTFSDEEEYSEYVLFQNMIQSIDDVSMDDSNDSDYADLDEFTKISLINSLPSTRSPTKDLLPDVVAHNLKNFSIERSTFDNSESTFVDFGNDNENNDQFLSTKSCSTTNLISNFDNLNIYSCSEHVVTHGNDVYDNRKGTVDCGFQSSSFQFCNSITNTNDITDFAESDIDVKLPVSNSNEKVPTISAVQEDVSITCFEDEPGVTNSLFVSPRDEVLTVSAVEEDVSMTCTQNGVINTTEENHYSITFQEGTRNLDESVTDNSVEENLDGLVSSLNVNRLNNCTAVSSEEQIEFVNSFVYRVIQNAVKCISKDSSLPVSLERSTISFENSPAKDLRPKCFHDKQMISEVVALPHHLNPPSLLICPEIDREPSDQGFSDELDDEQKKNSGAMTADDDVLMREMALEVSREYSDNDDSHVEYDSALFCDENMRASQDSLLRNKGFVVDSDIEMTPLKYIKKDHRASETSSTTDSVTSNTSLMHGSEASRSLASVYRPGFLGTLAYVVDYVCTCLCCANKS